MKDVIFYGIGNYYHENIGGVLKEYNPVALCDKDCKSESIISIEEAQKKYPGIPFFISVTPRTTTFFEIQKYLTDIGIRVENILNWESPEDCGLYYGLGCDYLDYYINTFNDRLEFCCSDFGKNRSPVIKYEGDVESAIDRYIEKRRHIIKGLNDGVQNECTGCIYLRKHYWHTDEHISALNFGFGAICNLRCTYCQTPALNVPFKNEELDFVISLIGGLKRRGIVDKDTSVDLASGEITVHPKRIKILNALKDFKVNVFSNCVMFEPLIAEYIHKRNWRVITSIDAGVPETFSKIKQCNEQLFYRVVDTIGKYQSSSIEGKHGVQIKYIVLPGVNDTNDNLQGFMEICHKTGVKDVFISRDCINLEEFPTETIEFCGGLIRQLNMSGINVYYPEYAAVGNDKRKIMKIVNEKRKEKENA